MSGGKDKSPSLYSIPKSVYQHQNFRDCDAVNDKPFPVLNSLNDADLDQRTSRH